MAEPFDPYRKWLGIPPSQQPPHHYRLLGIELFEEDPEVIDTAASQRMSYLQELGGGPYVKESQRLLNEVSAARRCLLDKQKKAEYDSGLKAKLSKAAPVKAPPKPPPVQKTSRVDDDDDTVTVKLNDLGISTESTRRPAAAKSSDAGKPAGGTVAEPRLPLKKRRRSTKPLWIGLLLAIGVVAVAGIYVANSRPAAEVAENSFPEVKYSDEELQPQAVIRPRENPVPRSAAVKPPAAASGPAATSTRSTPASAPLPTPSSSAPTFFASTAVIPAAAPSPTVRPEPTPPAATESASAAVPTTPPPASFFGLDEVVPVSTTYAHYTPPGSTLRELCGAFRIGDEYHLFYDAVVSATKSAVWGHAVSRDLYAWTDAGAIEPPLDVELKPVLGSVIVDRRNASGLGKEDVPPWLAAYTFISAGDPKVGVGLGISVSTDQGKSWKALSDEPLLTVREPTARRPRLVYHAPAKKWSICLFINEDAPLPTRKVTTVPPPTTTYRLYESTDLRKWTQSKEIPFKDYAAPASMVEVVDAADATKSQWLLVNGRGRYWFSRFDDAEFTTDRVGGELQAGGGCHGVIPVDEADQAKGLAVLSLLSTAGAKEGWITGAALAFPKRVFGRGDALVISRDPLPAKWLTTPIKKTIAELLPDAPLTVTDGGGQFQLLLDAELEPTTELRVTIFGATLLFSAPERSIVISGHGKLPLTSTHVHLEGTVDDRLVELTVNRTLVGFDAPTGPDSRFPLVVGCKGGKTKLASFSLTPLNLPKPAAAAKAAKQ